MKSKSFITFIICIVICGILAGCGQGKAEDATDKAAETADEEKQEEASSADADPEEKKEKPKKKAKPSKKEESGRESDDKEFDTEAAEKSLKKMSDDLSNFLWASMMKESAYSPMEARDIELKLSDEEKIRAAVLASDTDGVIDSTFVLGMGGFSEDKEADPGPDGDGFHGMSVSDKEVEENCLNLFGTKADWGELPPGPMCDLYDAVLYRKENDSCALIIDKEVETETDLKNQECTVTKEDGRYIGKVNMFWGYWGELEQKPGYSNYVATYTLEPNDESKYGMVVTSISISEKGADSDLQSERESTGYSRSASTETS